MVQNAESWFSRWLTGKKRTEAYLPDDKNKSVGVAVACPAALLALFQLSTTHTRAPQVPVAGQSGWHAALPLTLFFAFATAQIVWDEKKNRWVDTNEPEEEVRGAGGSLCREEALPPRLALWHVRAFGLGSRFLKPLSLHRRRLRPRPRCRSPRLRKLPPLGLAGPPEPL